MLNQLLTPHVRAVGEALSAAGFDALLVGGCVRDALIGTTSSDLDLVTSAEPADVRALLEPLAEVRSVYELGVRFGTVGVALVGGRTLEITRYREAAMGESGVEARFARDAAHRDFTVNAVAYDLATGSILDPLQGREDLRRRLLRAPGRPADRFGEDPIRVLRAARFEAELRFELDAQTAQALAPAATRLRAVAAERVRDELTKLLVAAGAPDGLMTLLSCGALAEVLPEVAALDAVSQPSFHDLDVFAHTVQAVNLSPATPVLRWATLLHDIGKAPARTVEADGRIRFFRHAQLGAEMASEICRRLRFSRDDTAAIVHLVGEHMRLGEVDPSNDRAVERAVRKLDLWAGAGDGARRLATAEDAVELTVADFAATAHRDEAPVVRLSLESAVARARERGADVPARLPITGEDLMRELGLAEGPEVGRALRAVQTAIDEGEIASVDRVAAMRVAARTVSGE